MSAARGGGLNGKNIHMNICEPWDIELNFTVDSTNGNGLGIRSLKSNGYVQNVFMNTSASFVGTTHTGTNVVDSIASTSSLRVGDPVQTTDLPAGTTIASITSSTAITLSGPATTGHASATITYQGLGLANYPNPNPLAGYCLVQFKNNFNYALSGSNSIVSPITSPTTAVTSDLTAGQAYVITVLGTTTLAEWQSIGLPLGLTPTVGQSFIATATGTGGSHTGKVGLPGFSTVDSIEIVGDPNQSISNSSIATNGGAWILVQFVSSATGSPALATPANNSVIALRFRFDRSSVSIPDGGPSNSGSSGGL